MPIGGQRSLVACGMQAPPINDVLEVIGRIRQADTKLENFANKVLSHVEQSQSQGQCEAEHVDKCKAAQQAVANVAGEVAKRVPQTLAM